MGKILLRGQVVLPDRMLSPGFVSVEGEKIVGVSQQASEMTNENQMPLDFGDAYIAPGFVDMHLHGALGKDVMDCEEESLRSIAVHQSRSGVTGFLGSTMSASMDSVLEAVGAIKKAVQQRFPSEILGVHIEGPFLSKEKKGAQDQRYIRELTENDLQRLIRAAHGVKVVISLAPEIGNNMAYISRLKKNGFIVAIGHSDATYEEAMESFQKGISHTTHLFNAMRKFDHREPGVVGAVLDTDRVTAELIADGIHVHPASLRLALACKGPEDICLVTDSLKASGVGDGVFEWGGREIEVKGPKATMKDSGVLAGSVLTLNKAVKNMIDWTRVSVNEAVNMASLNPARVLGLDEEIGSIAVGKQANLALLDRDFNVLGTVLHGAFVFEKM
jgi:N-acetylglucosamine-6-phosphate deacetylase